jgi:LPS export ABC transporter protein LptC
MKQQKLDLTISKRLNWRLLILISSVLFSISCKDEIETIKALPSRIKIPDQIGKDIVMDYTDTAKMQIKFITPEAHQYTNTEKPYSVFPLGIEVYFYDKDENISAIITSKYAKYQNKIELWEARDSVVARNIQTGEVIETEHMFWDAKKKIIYSEVFTKVTDEDGVYFGERGFEASQDLTYYRLIGSKGSVRVKDE